MTDDELTREELINDQEQPDDSRCRMELCVNWSGDGHVCNCAVLDIHPASRPWFE